jgi:hypothetical protein
MVLDKPLDNVNPDGTFAPGLAGGQLQHSVVGDGSFRSGLKPWQKLRSSIEILCNNQASGFRPCITCIIITDELLMRFWLINHNDAGNGQ